MTKRKLVQLGIVAGLVVVLAAGGLDNPHIIQ